MSPRRNFSKFLCSKNDPPMANIRLTDHAVAACQCPPNRKDVLIFDAVEPGFGLRVTSSGKRVFVFQYRFGREVRRVRLGVWGERRLTTSQARKQAEVLRGDVNRGQDPAIALRKTKTEAAAAKVEERRRRKAQAFTFEGLIKAWEQGPLKDRRPSYRKDAPARIRVGLPSLLERPARSIAQTEAREAIQAAADMRGAVGANRIMAYARAAYGWAVKQGLVDANPFSGLLPPAREVARDRVLSPGEVGAIWRAAESLGPIHGGFVRFLLLTLQRREDVAGARWSEFSPDLSVWTIPGARAKNGRAHIVHVTEVAREILAAVRPERWDTNTLVFGLPKNRKLSAFSTIKRRLTHRMEGEALGHNENSTSREARTSPVVADTEAAGRSPRFEAFDVHRKADWRFHDFRRTGVTRLAELGVPPHVADRLLNHVAGSIQGVAAVYQRAEFLNERRAALDLWASWVVELGASR